MRHDFAIGPPRESPLFAHKARLYYCARCGWSFLVGASAVVALDENGIALAGAEGARRFSTFEQGPCPASAALTADSVAGGRAALAPANRGSGEYGAPRRDRARPKLAGRALAGVARIGSISGTRL